MTKNIKSCNSNIKKNKLTFEFCQKCLHSKPNQCKRCATFKNSPEILMDFVRQTFVNNINQELSIVDIKQYIESRKCIGFNAYKITDTNYARPIVKAIKILIRMGYKIKQKGQKYIYCGNIPHKLIAISLLFSDDLGYDFFRYIPGELSLKLIKNILHIKKEIPTLSVPSLDYLFTIQQAIDEKHGISFTVNEKNINISPYKLIEFENHIYVVCGRRKVIKEKGRKVIEQSISHLHYYDVSEMSNIKILQYRAYKYLEFETIYLKNEYLQSIVYSHIGCDVKTKKIIIPKKDKEEIFAAVIAIPSLFTDKIVQLQYKTWKSALYIYTHLNVIVYNEKRNGYTVATVTFDSYDMLFDILKKSKEKCGNDIQILTPHIMDKYLDYKNINEFN